MDQIATVCRQRLLLSSCQSKDKRILLLKIKCFASNCISAFRSHEMSLLPKQRRGVCLKIRKRCHTNIFFSCFFLLFIKWQRLMLHAKCQPCHRDLHGWSLTLDCFFFFNIITQLEVQQTIAHASTCTLAACGDCIMWLWAQVLCGMPVYFLQLIDHMKSSELDFGSQWAREWYRLCECASMCVSAL